MLTASLAPISPVSVFATLGYQVPLNGSGTTDPQTYTVTSSNPDIPATVAKGQFLTFTVTHKASSTAGDINVNGTITFQLFQDLTPLTVAKIESFVQSGFYVKTGDTIHRVANGFPGTNDFILQGGSASGNGSGFSGIAGNPFIDEFNSQLAFTGTYQLAMANAGPDTNDTQFFITTGSPQFLNFHHTIFGQVVSGFDTINELTQVSKQSDGQTPVNPIMITSASLSTTNPNGVIHVDATKANGGETSTVTVTAHDSVDGSSTSQSFVVTATAKNPSVNNDRPILSPLPNPTIISTSAPFSTAQPGVEFAQTVAVNQPYIFQLNGIAIQPGDTLTYKLAGGTTTDSNGNAIFSALPASIGNSTVDANGVVHIVTTAGFTGSVDFIVAVRNQFNQAQVEAQQSNPSATVPIDTVSNFDYHWVHLTVSGTTPVALTPIASPVTANAIAATPTTVQLLGQSANPNTSNGLTYNIVSQPSHGSISSFNPQTGTLVYRSVANFQGTDTFQYTVTDSGTSTLTSAPATVTINVGLGNTGAVRVIGDVLVVTPPPRTDHGTNIINVSESNGVLLVTVNGVVDSNQPSASNIDRIVVYGSKASDQITINPNVDSTIPVTLDGGHGGGHNVLIAGSGVTREHGWFGHNKLVGGPGINQLIGAKRHVKFVPSSTTTVIFAGVPQRKAMRGGPLRAVKGTFYRVEKGRLVPTSPSRG